MRGLAMLERGQLEFENQVATSFIAYFNATMARPIPLSVLGRVYIHLVHRTVAMRLMMAAKHLSVFS